jgi:hypothetical protein
MENTRWLKIEYFHTLGDLGSKRLKVAALKLFHPTASPLFPKGIFLYCDTVSKGGGPSSVDLIGEKR